MPQPPNYNHERREREKLKAAKKAEKLEAKAAKKAEKKPPEAEGSEPE